jgi:hypothetical protein
MTEKREFSGSHGGDNVVLACDAVQTRTRRLGELKIKTVRFSQTFASMHESAQRRIPEHCKENKIIPGAVRNVSSVYAWTPWNSYAFTWIQPQPLNLICILQKMLAPLSVALFPTRWAGPLRAEAL